MAITERSFNLANWEEHPSDNRYIVFRFNKEPQGDQFHALLVKNNIEFEQHAEGAIRLFAVEKKDFDRARKLNYSVMAAHREPMIKNPVLRYGFVLVVLAAVTISLVGHCNRKAQDQDGVHSVPLEKPDGAV